MPFFFFLMRYFYLLSLLLFWSLFSEMRQSSYMGLKMSPTLIFLCSRLLPEIICSCSGLSELTKVSPKTILSRLLVRVTGKVNSGNIFSWLEQSVCSFWRGETEPVLLVSFTRLSNVNQILENSRTDVSLPKIPGRGSENS